MNKLFLVVISTFLNWFIITTIVDCFLMGAILPRYYSKNKIKSYFISKKNRFEFQDNVECSGFSSAYILRHFGMEADGSDLYQEISHKMKSGYVYPKEIPKLLLKYGIKAKYRRGNMNTLKREVSKGNPVIILIRYNCEKDWLHYVPVVGFDEKNIYMAESLKELVTCNDNCYFNREVPIQELKKLWNTSMIKMPYYKYTYFSIE